MTSSVPPPQPDQDSLKLDSDVDLNRLTEELIWLRAREGLVYDRVRDCNELMSIARAWKNAQASGISGMDDTSAAMEMVAQVLETERPIEHRDSLKVTYGLVALAHGLSRDERVRRYLDLPKEKRTVHSGPSIERHSKNMAAQLAAKLASVALSSNLSIGEASAKVQDADTPPESYSMDMIKARYRIKKDRFLKDIFYERKITCLVPGNHIYLARHIHYADLREGVHQIEPEFGCELIHDYHENGVYFATLRLAKTLAIGESFEFVYRISIHSANPFGHFVYLTPTTDVGNLAYSIQFAEDAIPRAFWTFSQVNYLDVLNQEYRRQVAHSHDGSRYIFGSWQDVHKRFSYGIDWDW